MCDVTVNVTEPSPARPLPSLTWFADRMREENRRSGYPLRECRGCDMPTRTDDFDYLFPRRCATCGAHELDKLVWRLVKRYGRRSTIKLLKRLGRK